MQASTDNGRVGLRLYHFTTGGEIERLHETGRLVATVGVRSADGQHQLRVPFSDSTDTDDYLPDTPWLVVIEIDEQLIAGHEDEPPGPPAVQRLLSALAAGRKPRTWLIPEDVLSEHARVVATRHVSRKYPHPEARDSDAAAVNAEEYGALIRAVHEMLTALVAGLGEGAATMEIDEEWAEIQPTTPGACEISVDVTSETEVDLVLSLPGDEHHTGIVLSDDDPRALAEEVRDHVQAVFAGRVIFTISDKWPLGGTRVRCVLASGQVRDHYNNVMIRSLVGRGDGWENIRPTAY